MLGRFRNLRKGQFFVPYFLVAQSTCLGAAIAVPPFVFEKNVILPRFFPVPPFAFFMSRSLRIKHEYIVVIYELWWAQARGLLDIPYRPWE